MVEFDHFKSEAGLHTFVLSTAEWINKTNAIGLYVKRGKYGSTYAHKDIAFEFASAISPVFKLYLIKEFQRLKEEENKSRQIEWNAKRFLSKNNYLIQTDAVKNYLLPKMNYRKKSAMADICRRGGYIKCSIVWIYGKSMAGSKSRISKKE